MRMPWLMQAAAREETGGAEASRLLGAGPPAGASGGALGLEKFSRAPCGFASSFFHIWDTSTKDFDLRSRISSAVLGAATQNGEDSTGLNECKGKWEAANLGCYVTRYTRCSGFGAHHPTTAGVLALALDWPRSSHIATIIPANSRVSSFTDLRVCHQCSGSKSPS